MITDDVDDLDTASSVKCVTDVTERKCKLTFTTLGRKLDGVSQYALCHDNVQ